MGKDPTLEESIAEVKKQHQTLTPEFIDLFVDVLYEMIVDLAERKKKELQSK